MSREVKKVNEIIKNHNWIFKPCPMCGSKDIGVKDTIIDVYFEKDCPAIARRKIWAYCRHCGATCGHTVADIIGDDEEIAAAIEKWNSRTLEEENDVIKLPEKATNGDVIKALFGADVIKKGNGWIETNLDGDTVYNLSWWNSPYKKEQTDAKADSHNK